MDVKIIYKFILMSCTENDIKGLGAFPSPFFVLGNKNIQYSPIILWD